MTSGRPVESRWFFGLSAGIPAGQPESCCDAELITLAIARNEDAFAELVRRHRRRVFHVALAVMGPSHAVDAEDIAQEAFVRLYQSLRSLRDGDRLGAWLGRLTFNLAIDTLRRARFAKPHDSEADLTMLADTTDRANPHAAFESGERERTVAAALAGLPPHVRAVLHLHYWLGYSVEETALLLAMPPGTVKSHLSRGRTALVGPLEPAR